MIKKTIALVALALVSSESVRASSGLTVTGRWAGTAFANSEFDFNGDGVAARQFNVRVYDALPFAGLEGVTDTALIGFGCSGPSSIELQAFGKLTFRGRFGDALYAEVDPNAPNLCFDPSNPNESLSIVLTGGTGVYANATGTGVLTLHDVVRLDKLVTIPGFPGLQIPAPLMVDTSGEFTLSIQ